jgi:hypothetical protein
MKSPPAYYAPFSKGGLGGEHSKATDSTSRLSWELF